MGRAAGRGIALPPGGGVVASAPAVIGAPAFGLGGPGNAAMQPRPSGASLLTLFL